MKLKREQPLSAQVARHSITTAYILLFSFAFAISATPSYAESTNTAPPVVESCGTEALNSYYDSGKYLREVSQATELAHLRLEKRLKLLSKEVRPAVVLDIDDTALSTWPILKQGGFCWKSERFSAYIEQGNAPAILPVLQFFKYARQQKVTVFFLTSRSEKYRSATERNLRAVGFEGFQEVIMRSDSPSGKKFKEDARQKIKGSGYQIIMSMGDQLGDLSNPPTPDDILIPNPFYTTK